MNKRVKYLFLCIFSSTLLAACGGGDHDWRAVYEECKQNAEELQAEVKKSSQDSDADPQTRAMMESMGTMTANMAMSMCETIRTTCEKDPDGAVCRSYKVYRE